MKWIDRHVKICVENMIKHVGSKSKAHERYIREMINNNYSNNTGAWDLVLAKILYTK